MFAQLTNWATQEQCTTVLISKELPPVLKSVLRGGEETPGTVWHHNRQQLFHHDEKHGIEASRWAVMAGHAYDIMRKF